MYFLFYQIFGLESEVLRICNCLHIFGRPGGMLFTSSWHGRTWKPRYILHYCYVHSDGLTFPGSSACLVFGESKSHRYKKEKLFWKSMGEAKKANNGPVNFLRDWWSPLLWNWYFIPEKTKCKTWRGSGGGLCQVCTYLEEMYVKLQAARLGETSCWLCHSAKYHNCFSSLIS